jgi:hypothetical protein
VFKVGDFGGAETNKSGEYERESPGISNHVSGPSNTENSGLETYKGNKNDPGSSKLVARLGGTSLRVDGVASRHSSKQAATSRNRR